MWPFSEPEKPNSITEIDEKAGSLICLECGETPRELLNIDGLYYCEPCYEAKERRERFENEEVLWSQNNERKEK